MTNKSTAGDFDLAELEALTHGDKSLLNELIELFIEQTSIQLNNLDNAVQTGDFELIRTITHSLKSSYLLIGFGKKELILNLEQIAKNPKQQSKKEIQKILLQLKKETVKVIKQLEKSL
jgi:HPt (histidine-containing phosphotransfer) domain-containing protein